jgi:hypothetical protein
MLHAPADHPPKPRHGAIPECDAGTLKAAPLTLLSWGRGAALLKSLAHTSEGASLRDAVATARGCSQGGGWGLPKVRWPDSDIGTSTPSCSACRARVEALKLPAAPMNAAARATYPGKSARAGRPRRSVGIAPEQEAAPTGGFFHLHGPVMAGPQSFSEHTLTKGWIQHEAPGTFTPYHVKVVLASAVPL